jgi:hypothetical protein
VQAYNEENEGQSRIVIFSAFQASEYLTKINIGVYSNSIDECTGVLNSFANAQPEQE